MLNASSVKKDHGDIWNCEHDNPFFGPLLISSFFYLISIHLKVLVFEFFILAYKYWHICASLAWHH